MNFCSQCGKPVTQRIPEGDARLRFVCDHCSTIHYQNPNIVAGTVPAWGDKVLLCRRAIEPRRGFWTLPAGFMENGETLDQAARRETVEEACAQVGRADYDERSRRECRVLPSPSAPNTRTSKSTSSIHALRSEAFMPHGLPLVSTFLNMPLSSAGNDVSIITW